MGIKKFWKDMTYRVSLKRTDKLMVGNVDDDKAGHIQVEDVLKPLNTDDLAESPTKLYKTVAERDKIANTPANTNQELADRDVQIQENEDNVAINAADIETNNQAIALLGNDPVLTNGFEGYPHAKRVAQMTGGITKDLVLLNEKLRAKRNWAFYWSAHSVADGNLPSVIPNLASSDGSGFVRNSTKQAVGKYGNTTELAIDMPPVTYVDDGNLGFEPVLNLENSGTNHCKKSEDLSAFNYSFESPSTFIVTPNPIGSSTVINCVPTTNINQHRFAGSSGLSAQFSENDEITVSMYIKPNGYCFIRLGGVFGAESSDFDLQNGTVLANSANVLSSKIERVPDGFFRLQVRYTFQNQIENGFLYAGILIFNDASFSSYAGDGTSGIYLTGTQIELNTGAASSYIKTTGVPVTRAADVPASHLIGDRIDSSSFSVYAKVNINTSATANRILSVYGEANSSNRVQFKFGSSVGEIVVLVYQAGVLVLVMQVVGIDLTVAVKTLVRCSNKDYALFVNGQKVDSDNVTISFVSDSLDTIRLGEPSGNLPLTGNTIEYGVTRSLTDAESMKLTTL